MPLVLTLCLLCGCGSLDRKLTVVEESPLPERLPGPEELSQYWYGYWYLTDAQGDWSSLEGYSWDCCGQLSAGGRIGSILIWDEDMPKDYYLASFDLQQSDGEYICTGGEFLDIELGAGDAWIKLTDDEGMLLDISGGYSDGSTGSFYYVLTLRPWGDEWPQGKSCPYYYERWYLPKIEAGEDPPDVIEPYE